VPHQTKKRYKSILTEIKPNLPNDFYELYEWRNGNSEYFPRSFSSGYVCEYNPINVVAEDMKWEWHNDTPPMYKGCITLPFITLDSEFVAIALGRSYAQEAHVVYVDEVGESYLYCDSVTSMLESTIECFASGAVLISDEGCITENQQIISEIWRSRNPQTLAEAMLDFTQSLEVCQSEGTFGKSVYSNAITSLISALRTLRMLKPQEVIILAQDSLARIQQTSSDESKGLKFALDNWLRESIPYE
jgi:hypothetical protein